MEGEAIREQPQDIPEQVAQENAEVEAVVEEQPVEEAPQPYQAEEVEEDWEHKYKVLKGKYDSEVPRLIKELKRLRREKEELSSRLDLLEKMVTMQKISSAPSEEEKKEEEDEEIKKFKEDYPDIYKAMEKLLMKKFGKVENRIKDMSTQMTQQQFFAQLTALVPEWQKLNTDPDFLDWLQEVDPSSGYTRHQLMLYAYNQMDVNGVARWFKKYLSEVENKMNEKEQSLASKNVAPPHRKITKASELPKRTYTESEIRKFYTDVALGKIPPDKREKLEEEYTRALLEGRVIFGK